MQYPASNTKGTCDAKVNPCIATVYKSIWVNFDDIGKYVPQWIESWNKQIVR
ncbi:hypothetical protein [Burkholderia ubonensis]|uniref:hypothetical protein n=1 Tax=Burkholderia ubonensis TaxID=101571 RepID=UPI000ACA9A06|nr:hypothetical protein [Burkholderia ubonensis]